MGGSRPSISCAINNRGFAQRGFAQARIGRSAGSRAAAARADHAAVYVARQQQQERSFTALSFCLQQAVVSAHRQPAAVRVQQRADAGRQAVQTRRQSAMREGSGRRDAWADAYNESFKGFLNRKVRRRAEFCNGWPISSLQKKWLSVGRPALDHLLQLALFVHVDEQVAAADELAVDVALRDRRPVREAADFRETSTLSHT